MLSRLALPAFVLFVWDASVVAELAAVKLAAVKLAAVKLAAVKLAAVKLAAVKLAAVKLAAVKPSPAVGSLSVVVNSKNTTSNLSRTRLKRILKGDLRHWKGLGKKVQLVLPSYRSAARDILKRKVYGTSLTKHFRKAAYQQKGSKPVYHGTRAALRLVKSNPAAIAVVPTSGLKTDPKLRVLTIGKKKPGSIGYFLNSSVIKP